MSREKQATSSRREWWILIGGAIALMVGISLLEKIVPEAPRPSHSTEELRGVFSPVAPEVHRLEDGGIEIRHDSFRRTTIRLEDEEQSRALFDCLEQGIERTFGSGTEGWDQDRIRRETRQIREECMELHGVSIPMPPSLPGLPGDR